MPDKANINPITVCPTGAKLSFDAQTLGDAVNLIMDTIEKLETEL